MPERTMDEGKPVYDVPAILDQESPLAAELSRFNFRSASVPGAIPPIRLAWAAETSNGVLAISLDLTRSYGLFPRKDVRFADDDEGIWGSQFDREPYTTP